MTTGRINQVTIVRRGWPTGRRSAPEEIFSTWLALWERAASRRPGRATDSRWRHPPHPS